MKRLLAFLSTWIREPFTANVGLKSVSFIVAFILVAYTRGQLEETQRTIPVASCSGCRPKPRIGN
jgi:hypothetical protein